ncbi:MAG: DUF6285 domain-containing protein [Byssovorax sp.]
MQQRPDKTELLTAVARFLEREVKPAIKDPALAFRVLIAASLTGIVAGELQTEDAATAAELSRLARILPEAATAIGLEGQLATREGRKEALVSLNRALCDRIRSADFVKDPQVWSHVTLTLRGELFTSSPRFDTSIDIE